MAHYGIDRSIELNPNFAFAQVTKGLLANWEGDFATAEDAFRRSMRLSPLDPEKHWTLYGLTVCYVQTNRNLEGAQTGLATIAAKPDMHVAFPITIRCLVGLGRLEEARELAGKLLVMVPNFTVSEHMKTVVSRVGRSEIAAVLREAGLPE
jgi:tetratricopeptide (TPR) repeat protein